MAVIPSSEPAQPDQAFPFLGSEALRALGLLSTPLYIYSFETQHFCWSNERARSFWNAPSEAELHNRTLTPYSESTSIRLIAYLEAFRRGEDRVESWVFYPKGVATSALCRCSGVSLEGHDEAMLVEIRDLSGANLPQGELRAIEALRHTPLKISLFSAEGRVLMRNPSAVDTFGGLDESLPEDDDHFRAMFADPRIADELLDDARRDGVSRRIAAISLPGSPVHNIQITPTTDPATGEAAILAAQQDVSQTVEIGRQLAASEEALDSILSLNVVPSVVFAVGDGRVLNYNHAAQELLKLGLSPKSSPPELSAQALFADAGAFLKLRTAILGAGAGNATLGLRASDGSSFWASVAGARITYAKQDSVVVLITDIDQLYRTAVDLEAALDSERRVSEMQRRFLAIASHEFRTPLAIIDGAAQRIERHVDTLSPEMVRGRASRIRATVKRLVQLLDNTIERARNDQERQPYAPEALDLAALVTGVAHSFADTHPDLQLTLNLPTLPTLQIDRALMEQVLGNLLANAVKYSPPPPRVDIRATVGSGSVELLIRDWGIGIPADERERVFSEYVRASNVGDRRGTGLGLAIVRQAVILHGGSVDIVDTTGPGTTFRVILPRR